MAFISDEELHEKLISMESVKEREKRLQLELNLLLDGLKVITMSVNAAEAFIALTEKFRMLVQMDDAFIVSKVGERFVPTISSDKVFQTIKWENSNLMQRVQKGETVICNDVSKIADWQQQSPEITGKVASALYTPLISIDKISILICTSETKTFFTRAHREIMSRFSLLMTQALINAENMTTIKESHRIADLDMAMAINVQKTLLNRQIPESPYWDIAFYFQPMAGVSGDMYDFYANKQGNLNGISLYDVSGHGIASALITMIAKTITFKAFSSYRTLSLGKVMQLINRELIHEIGSVDNYLTGVLLRLGKEWVEYANAGHPDLLYRNKRTGSVHCVNGKETDIKGFFLGLEGNEFAYKSLRLRVKEGDYLLLYSDCLMETKNISGEEYGIGKVMNVMRDFHDLSAREALDLLIDDFKIRTGKEIFQDDLTIIVLKRISRD